MTTETKKKISTNPRSAIYCDSDYLTRMMAKYGSDQVQGKVTYLNNAVVVGVFVPWEDEAKGTVNPELPVTLTVGFKEYSKDKDTTIYSACRIAIWGELKEVAKCLEIGTHVHIVGEDVIGKPFNWRGNNVINHQISTNKGLYVLGELDESTDDVDEARPS